MSHKAFPRLIQMLSTAEQLSNTRSEVHFTLGFQCHEYVGNVYLGGTKVEFTYSMEKSYLIRSLQPLQQGAEHHSYSECVCSPEVFSGASLNPSVCSLLKTGPEQVYGSESTSHSSFPKRSCHFDLCQMEKNLSPNRDVMSALLCYQMRMKENAHVYTCRHLIHS